MPDLRFAAALSTQAEASRAVAETCEAALAELGGTPDLAFAFVSHHHGPDFAPLAAALCDALGTKALLGCTGESIVGGDREVENQPALSLWLARLPGASLSPMHLAFERAPEGGAIVGWPSGLAEPWPDGAALIVLGEPFSFPADLLLERMNEDRPGVPVLGGMASGGWSPGQNRLLFGRREFNDGAVAVLLSGVRVRSVVSQGCRPIGRHYVITKSQRNVIQELSGQPPLAQLQALLPELTAEERQQMQSGLHVGRVVNEYQGQFERGDFLVRNVVGADPESGAIALGDYVRTGQTVQFHLRDAESADEDLRTLLRAAREAGGGTAGGLLFTYNGRGTRLFERPDHDARAVRQELGPLPLAGFFAQGELGPIAGRNALHGFTASLALIDGAS